MQNLLYIAMLITVLLPMKGITFFQHYCGGELISYKINDHQSEPCCDDHDEPCGACEDQKMVLALDDFQLSKLELSFWNVAFAPALYSQLQLFLIQPQVLLNYFYSNLTIPLCGSGRHRYMLCQSFLL